nr:AtpZ/AtpI family protein [uncultured Anaerostipes sp.]
MKKYGQIFRMLGLITQLGLTMLTSVFLCMFAGLWIDRKFSTHFFVVFLILGILGGIKAVYMLIRRMDSGSEEDSHER